MATFLDALADALQDAAAYNQADQAAPVAVLWPDRDRQWQVLVPRLREYLPVLTLGEYDPGARTGPAIWLRCLVDRTLPEADWPVGAIPVLYLPGVGRQDLRTGDDCPRILQPLVELQYRGTLWCAPADRDWTVAGFLRASGVDVASDHATEAALVRALDALADEDLDALRQASPLKASFLNFLVDSRVHPDLMRSVLLWMNHPAGERARRSEAEWQAFRALCHDHFGFDPVSDGEVTAGARLGQQEGSWMKVWQRFREAPARFPGIPDLLRRAKPAGEAGLFLQRSAWPQENEAEETALRGALAGLAETHPEEIRQALLKAEERHGERRDWVWAELGDAPLARLLPALLRLAEAARQPLVTPTIKQMADAYVQNGWRADAALLEVLACVENPEDVAAVRPVADALYRPWVRDGAQAFQAAWESQPGSAPQPEDGAPVPVAGRCLLFADGLRMDVARLLQAELEQHGLTAGLEWRLAAVPTVTSTTKPWVSPVASRFSAGPEFTPTGPTGTRVDAPMLRKLLEEAGFAPLGEEAPGDPAGAAWTECGRLDALGHTEGWRLAYRLRGEVRVLADRIRALLQAGWSEVRVLTDHGWLLLPFALPKEDLPEHLTEKRKGRCARLKPDANTSLPTLPWHWDPSVRIALAPGITCFVEGKEYEHGGLSPQECVVPVLSVKSKAAAKPVSIEKVTWRGLRCDVQLSAAAPGAVVDLRTKAADPGSSLAAASKPPRDDGRASLVCEDDQHIGTAALVVVLAPGGAEILAQQATVVGE